jgi:predicted DNA-binding transcriptional regulator AlpA
MPADSRAAQKFPALLRRDNKEAVRMEFITTKPILPETGYLRLTQIIGSPKANPPIPALIPVSKSTWWAGIKSGFFPRPLKLGPRITVWRVEDIRAFISRTSKPAEK